MFAAVSTQMCSWAQLFAHQASVSRIAESHQHAQQGVYLAILYDEITRKQWGTRAARGEVMDLLKEAHTPLPDLVAAAQSRLQDVLQRAGIQESVSAPTGHVLGDVGLATVMAQQEAATTTLYRRAQDANRAMITEAERLRAREEAMLKAETEAASGAGRGGANAKGGANKNWYSAKPKGGGKGGAAKGGDAQLSNRKKKAMQFFAKQGRGGRRGGK